MVEDRYRERPARIVFGESAWCYRCRGNGKNPDDKTKFCGRCNGIGIIPNRGPIQAQKKP